QIALRRRGLRSAQSDLRRMVPVSGIVGLKLTARVARRDLARRDLAMPANLRRALRGLLLSRVVLRIVVLRLLRRRLLLGAPAGVVLGPRERRLLVRRARVREARVALAEKSRLGGAVIRRIALIGVVALTGEVRVVVRIGLEVAEDGVR